MPAVTRDTDCLRFVEIVFLCDWSAEVGALFYRLARGLCLLRFWRIAVAAVSYLEALETVILAVLSSD